MDRNRNLQLNMAVGMVVLGAGLLLGAFIAPPPGQIDGSVLVAFGEILSVVM